MVRLALLVGAVVAPLTALAVFLDASRRSTPRRARFLWASVAGLLSFVGFGLPVVLDGLLHRFYLRLVHGAPVAVTPYELLAFDVGVGLAVSAFAGITYAAVTRCDG